MREESLKRVRREYLLRECDLDVFGHVNNVAIFQYLENARWDFIADSGFNGVTEMQRTQKGLVVLSANIQFRRELRCREKIWIETAWTSFDRRLGVMRQEIFNCALELACSAEYKMGLMDLEKRRLVTPDEHWLKVLGLT